MKAQEFEKLVEEALRRIPRKFRRKMENIAVIIEDEPSKETLRQMGIRRGETLLGLYQGVPFGERGHALSGAMPDTITIFQKPIEGAARSREELITIVRDTVVHEIAHYFGFTDEEIEELMGE